MTSNLQRIQLHGEQVHPALDLAISLSLHIAHLQPPTHLQIGSFSSIADFIESDGHSQTSLQRHAADSKSGGAIVFTNNGVDGGVDTKLHGSHVQSFEPLPQLQSGFLLGPTAHGSQVQSPPFFVQSQLGFSCFSSDSQHVHLPGHEHPDLGSLFSNSHGSQVQLSYGQKHFSTTFRNGHLSHVQFPGGQKHFDSFGNGHFSHVQLPGGHEQEVSSNAHGLQLHSPGGQSHIERAFDSDADIASLLTCCVVLTPTLHSHVISDTSSKEISSSNSPSYLRFNLSTFTVSTHFFNVNFAALSSYFRNIVCQKFACPNNLAL